MFLSRDICHSVVSCHSQLELDNFFNSLFSSAHRSFSTKTLEIIIEL